MPVLRTVENALPFSVLPHLLDSCAAPVAHWYLVGCDAEEVKNDDDDADESLAGSGDDLSPESSPYLPGEKIHLQQQAIEVSWDVLRQVLRRITDFENVVIAGVDTAVTVRFPYEMYLYETSKIVVDYRDSWNCFLFTPPREIFECLRKSLPKATEMPDEEFFRLGPW